jgi:outer membrane lipoprotein-sorting protein
MKKAIFIIALGLLTLGFNYPDGSLILEKVDQNMSSKNRVFESSMIIHGRRNSRTIGSKTISEGTKKSFTEYLSPASEKGTKMLKLQGQLWIYSSSTDRTIQISGNMLRQSVMGSDLSYEDMMDDRKLIEIYSAKVTGEEKINDRNTFIVELRATVENVAYYAQKMWIDQERYVPLKEELYAKSGQLLKRVEFKEIQKIQGRWFPTTIIYKDVLKDGNGTEFKMTNLKFNQNIPDYIFTKAALKQ